MLYLALMREKPMKCIKNVKTIILEFKSKPEQELQTRTTSWRGFDLSYSALPLPIGYDFKGCNPEHHYLAYHDLMLKDGEMEIDGSPLIKGNDLRETMTYIPSGRHFKGWTVPETRKNSFTILTYNPGLVSDEIESLYTGWEWEPQIYFKNENLRSTMLKIEHLLKSDIPNSSLYLETLGLMAALEMVMFRMSPGSLDTQLRGGLSKTQKEHIREYVRLNLTKDITLDELASLAQMSRFHFSRSFKQSFGDSPIRYINRERFKFAQSLLSESRLPISDIATHVGFGSVQRFMKIFRDFSGMTPTEYRKQT
jgi:AraC family transcriptional regulator